MDLEAYYQFVYENGKLRTMQHARRWSAGVLRTLGTALDRKTKQKLAKELPDELAQSIKDVFWLLHFRDPGQTREEFLQRAARRSGNSNAEFAIYPTLVVFAGVRSFISTATDKQVAETLSPRLRELWERASELYPIQADFHSMAEHVMQAA